MSRPIAAGTLVAVACGGTPPAPEPAPVDGPTPYVVTLPPFIEEMPVPADNPLTVQGVALGRHLFYDPMLSRTGDISCASCHRQENAFSDPRPVSIGVEGRMGRRNAMPIFNLAWAPSLFWDGRAASIEEQVLGPIANELEMDQDLDVLVAALQRHDRYPAMFDAAFPGVPITPTTLAKALAQFVRSIVSFDSTWDNVQGIYDIDSEPADRGHKMFMVKMPMGDEAGVEMLCHQCHQAEVAVRKDWVLHRAGLFTANELRSNGMPDAGDRGLAERTDDEADTGKFRVPSLRNLAYTAPYMHDGSLETMTDVLEHYNRQIVAHAGTDPLLMRDGEPLRLNIDPATYGDLIAFLDLLKDRSLTTNPAWSNPFETP